MKSMMLSALLTTSLLGGALAEHHCEHGTGDFSARYSIYANDIPDVPGICGGLWDNLKGFSNCQLVTEESCEPGEGYDGQHYDMVWTFGTMTVCDPGSVEAVWWEATKNEWGSINCDDS